MTSLAKARVASKLGAGSTVWPMPMSPVMKRGTPMGELKRVKSLLKPHTTSWRLSDGS